MGLLSTVLTLPYLMVGGDFDHFGGSLLPYYTFHFTLRIESP